MRLGIMIGYSGARLELPLALVQGAEAAGFDSAWTSEAWGSDAVTTAAWLLASTSRLKVGTAIMQTPARTPSCTAMTAMSLDQLSGGRFLLGLGPSGPQVAEGWYGQPYGPALGRLREYITIVRRILAREAPLELAGRHYRIPYDGDDATGLGKPLKSILRASPEIPLYTAAVTPGGLRLAAELADGVFPIWMDPERRDLLAGPLEEGFAKAGRDPARFDLAPFVQVHLDDDLEAARLQVKQHLALYIGGMGARDKNFYKDYAARLGYAEAAAAIQERFLAGSKREAVAAVPDELVDACALVGPAGRIRERLERWRRAGERGDIGTMIVATSTPGAVDLLAKELL